VDGVMDATERPMTAAQEATLKRLARTRLAMRTPMAYGARNTANWSSTARFRYFLYNA
jgi:hypothetical protein